LIPIQRMETATMATPEERAEFAAIEAWLKTPSEARQTEQDDLAGLRDYLRADRRGFDPAFLRLLLPPTRRATAEDFRQAERDIVGWQGLGYGIEQARRWLESGTEPHEYWLVQELVAEGISPVRAAQQFEHPKTGERTTILDIARRFRDEFETLNDALDDAEIERVKGERPSNWFRRR
jgi:hypothetical protein